MFAVHINGDRQVVHDFPRITLISLQQERFGIGAAAFAGAIGKDAFGTVIHQIDIVVAGQRFGEFLVVGREVAIVIDCAGISQLRHRIQYWLLYIG